MQCRLKLFASDSADFVSIKKDGFCGVIFSAGDITEENLKNAKRSGLKRLIHIGSLEKSECKCISKGGINKGTVFAVTVKSVKESELNGLILQADGLVIPFPCVSGLLWDDKFYQEYEEFCGKDLYKELPALFDKDLEKSDFRLWYYERASYKVFYEYVLPVAEYIKSLGKAVYFDFGNMSKGHYAVRKLILPSLFEKAGIFGVREEKDGECFAQKRGRKEILLVTPLRAIMQMYAWDAGYSKEESEFSLAVCEAEYYKNSLEKCGFSVYITDDFGLSHMSISRLRRFDSVLIQKSCLLEEGKMEKLQKIGINVNNKLLLEMMDKVN